MKKIILLLIVIAIYTLETKAQMKMVAKSTYSFDGTGYNILDTSTYFNNPANLNPVHENFTDAFNYAIFDSSHYYYFNQSNQLLELITRNIVTFDPGFTHQTLSNSYNYTNNVNDTRDDFANFYTGNNLDSQYFEHTILSPLSTIFYSKNFLHYNAANNADTAWYVSFQLGNYTKTNKYYYIFNAQNLIEETYSLESTDSVTYTTKGKSVNFYNVNGNLDSTINYYWLSGVWNKYSRQLYNYNVNNMKTLSETSAYNSLTQLYTPSNRIQYLRTNGTLLDTSYKQSYNQTTLKYDTLNKNGFIYYNGLLLHEYGYTFNQVTTMWEPTTQVSVINYYYNLLPNSTADIQTNQKELLLFPNPCETYLQLKSNLVGAKFAIFSTDGKFIQSGKINANNQVFVQSLPDGMYIFKTELDGKNIQELFIKQ